MKKSWWSEKNVQHDNVVNLIWVLSRIHLEEGRRKADYNFLPQRSEVKPKLSRGRSLLGASAVYFCHLPLSRLRLPRMKPAMVGSFSATSIIIFQVVMFPLGSFFSPLLNCLCFCCLNENRKWIQELGWHTAHNFYYFISEAVHVSWIMLSSSARSMRVSGFFGARRFLQNETKNWEKSEILALGAAVLCVGGVSTRSSEMET